MKIEIENELKREDLFELADAYRESYNTLSEDYKTPEEMELYTKKYFLRKLEKFRKGQNESPVFVAKVDGKPVGFLRFSPIEEYYKNHKNGVAKNKEIGELDGHQYEWERKIEFSKDIKLSDKTAILNQIYIDPKHQKHGVGEALFNHAMPEMKKQYDDFIVELNSGNEGARTVYGKVLTAQEIARTQDLDHILKGRKYISPVTMVHAKVDAAIDNLKDRRLKRAIKHRTKADLRWY